MPHVFRNPAVHLTLDPLLSIYRPLRLCFLLPCPVGPFAADAQTPDQYRAKKKNYSSERTSGALAPSRCRCLHDVNASLSPLAQLHGAEVAAKRASSLRSSSSDAVCAGCISPRTMPMRTGASVAPMSTRHSHDGDGGGGNEDAEDSVASV